MNQVQKFKDLSLILELVPDGGTLTDLNWLPRLTEHLLLSVGGLGWSRDVLWKALECGPGGLYSDEQNPL